MRHNQLERHLQEVAADGRPAAVYLIHGEEFLRQRCLKALVDALLPGAERSLGYEPITGEEENVFDVVERLNTYSMLSGRKVVALLDSRVFQGRQDAASLLEKARAAHGRDETRKAAGLLLGALALLDLDVEQARDPDRRKELTPESAEGEDGWIDEVLTFIEAEAMRTPPHQGADAVLAAALEKGFPEKHTLVMSVERVDKRRRLYQTIRAGGVVVDGTVPSGARQVDRQARDALFTETVASMERASGKTLTPGARRLLRERTGFDLRTVAGCMEKLTAFAGDRKRITEEDVDAVVDRTRKDPLYAFTDAVTDRNAEGALRLLRSLLRDGEGGHPLQLLAAMVNQFRRLMAVKGAAEAQGARVWFPGCSFHRFQQDGLPVLKELDARLTEAVLPWVRERGEGKKGEGKTDLALVPGGRSPYPLYLAFGKADRFTRDELVETFRRLQRADLQIKTTNRDPAAALEQLVLFICSGR
jgi:DNA polymerase-3 subunit delta